jgi:superfamily II DNA helicase RecQ
LDAIVTRRSWILAVMATGVGKSLLFMLPAMLSPQGMTVVVVPLLSLGDDLQDRCTKLGIRCEKWNADKQPDGAQIVLVTPEGTASDAFHTFMNRQRMMGVLDRIVFDECHVVKDSMDGFRLKVLDLDRLGRYQTQLVYLTATLKPTDEEAWFRVIGLPMEKVLMVRDVTTRRNIRYYVQPYRNGEDEDEQIRELVQQKCREYPLPG